MRQFLFKPVDAATLGAFRLVWGLLLFAEAFARFKHVTGVYSPTYRHFRYFGFEWVPLPASHGILYAEVVILCLLAIMIVLGLWSRVANVGYGLLYLHLFFIDEIYYNNHYYLTVLLCGLMVFTHADKAFSIWSFRNRDTDGCAPPVCVPAWQYWILRGQIVILYFYGGLAKLNIDWLGGEPVRYWFSMKEGVIFPLSLVVHKEWFVWVASYGGIVIDLCCPFMLLFKRTRWIACIVLISFHAMNSQLFQIGYFPLIGMAMLILFFPPSAARKVWGRFQQFVAGVQRIRLPEKSDALLTGRHSQALLVFFGIYFALQILLPFRYHLYGQRADWTEIGQKFAWRMMLRNKDSYIKFLFSKPGAEDWLNEHPDLRPHIANDHVERMSDSPWMLLQYARMLDEVLEKNGFPDTEIRVVSVVSLNDRPYRVMIDPTVDLTEADFGVLKVPDWIVPLDPKATQQEMPLTTEDRMKAIQAGVDDYFKAHPDKAKVFKEQQRKASGS